MAFELVKQLEQSTMWSHMGWLMNQVISLIKERGLQAEKVAKPKDVDAWYSGGQIRKTWVSQAWTLRVISFCKPEKRL